MDEGEEMSDRDKPWKIVRELSGKTDVISRHETYGDAYAKLESMYNVPGQFEIVEK